MKWITIHYCADCETQIYHIGRNGIDRCNCDEEPEGQQSLNEYTRKS